MCHHQILLAGMLLEISAKDINTIQQKIGNYKKYDFPLPVASESLIVTQILHH